MRSSFGGGSLCCSCPDSGGATTSKPLLIYSANLLEGQFSEVLRLDGVLGSQRSTVNCLAMNLGGSSVGGREAIVTLVACALLGFEAVPNLLFGLVVVLRTGGTP